jgi:hypothetical protein
MSMVGIERERVQRCSTATRRVTSRFPVEHEISVLLGRVSAGGQGFSREDLKHQQRRPVHDYETVAPRLPGGDSDPLACSARREFPLQFVASGPVIRSEATHAAVRMKRYEFRTGTTSALVAPPRPANKASRPLVVPLRARHGSVSLENFRRSSAECVVIYVSHFAASSSAAG